MTLNNFAPFAGCCLLALSLVVTTGHAYGTPPKAPSKFAPVAAIAKAKCLGCHNDKRHPEGVDLSSYKSLMKGGEEGPIVVAGHPEKSGLLLYVDGTKQPRMPFKQPPLRKAEITTIKNWIKAGAKA